MNNDFMNNIKIIGIGGCGIRILNRIIKSGVSDADFIAVDYDATDLSHSNASVKIELKSLYSSLAHPENSSPTRIQIASSGLQEESDIRREIGAPDVVIVIAGLGGATGSGATPIITELAKEAGALTVVVVTRPFRFEGESHSINANDAIKALCKESSYCSTFPHTPNKEVMAKFSSGRTATLFAFPCDQLLLMKIDNKMSPAEAFGVIDGLLSRTVRHIIRFFKMGFLAE
ncbi:hypothetical protein ACFLX4_00280 [Chloroflexota bacterium]